MVAGDEGVLRRSPQAPDLLRLHEAVATLFATQGDWRRAYQHLRSALDIARDGSLRDALTSSYNRRYLDERLYGPFADRQPGPLAIALVDLDRFKRVNDTYGHLVGDRVLRRVADLLQEELPPEGFCARYGGEEFVLWLPGVDAGHAVRIVEAARVRVARHPWSELQPGLRVTISAGLAHEGPAVPERQLRSADDLLYAAKRAGRNKVAYQDAQSTRLITHSE
ncbi:diguanylate cyclase (GGDEF) domain-containing protein [Amycolatopsis pretoriensis]|uniref:Diguanylate cyclase (GGDEF) domain-containing protein n=1 Tax=Amycolatopsis pretoriensis TaxID=218821 RepID=A0A1H5QSU2_9PSEU|nr:GGDEF domain-containing protein [Amycolatopsis pretoriensis]SEF28914.1 diguanylate cyclase (GGDEF) domain-containing protein [Amycolatopsis pretoriensis]